MYQIPQSVQIFGHSVQVIEQPELKAPDGGDLLGRYTHSKGLIEFNSGMIDSLKPTTVLHEIIEAIDRHADLKMNHTQITTLASSLAQAFATSVYSSN